MTQSDRTSRGPSKVLLFGGPAAVAAALLLLFVLPAETGWDPLGTGAATGLNEIADPDNPELERGMARMENQEVLALSDAAPGQAAGVSDTWEYELAPYESIEFKYTLPEGRPMTFRWEASGPLNYDMHAHPFEGGTDLTESYGIDEAAAMQGTYTPAFTGEHGWYWDNRSTDNVTLRLTASGPMTTSTVYGGGSAMERPIQGATGRIEGEVEGHQMQGAGAQ
jgi:hypothetical protein